MDDEKLAENIYKALGAYNQAVDEARRAKLTVETKLGHNGKIDALVSKPFYQKRTLYPVDSNEPMLR